MNNEPETNFGNIINEHQEMDNDDEDDFGDFEESHVDNNTRKDEESTKLEKRIEDVNIGEEKEESKNDEIKKKEPSVNIRITKNEISFLGFNRENQSRNFLFSQWFQ